MDEAAIKELEHKAVLYRQMVDIYPSETKYLRRLSEILLQLGHESEAMEKMRTLERLYKRLGQDQDAQSIKGLRKSIAGQDPSLDGTMNPFLSDIKPGALQMLMKDGKRRELGEGERLIRQGDKDDVMYIILEGELAVLVEYEKHPQPTMLCLLHEGDIVGEIAFLEGCQRSASVVANSKTSVLELSNKRVLQCLLEFPEVGEALRRGSDLRKHLTAINSNELLARLPDEAKEELARHASMVHLPSFQVVSRSRRKLDWVGIMVSGLIRLVAEDSKGNSHILTPIKPGAAIAVNSALLDEPPMADMVTVTDSTILQIPVKSFRQVMNAQPQIRTLMLEQITEQLSGTVALMGKTA